MTGVPTIWTLLSGGLEWMIVALSRFVSSVMKQHWYIQMVLQLSARQNDFGVHFFGSDGEVMVDRGKFRVIVKGKTIASYAGSGDKHTNCPAEVEKAEKMLLNNASIRLYESKSHYEDFLSCVASRKKPVANEQIGGRSVICCHLMNQLYFNNTSMKWDPAKFSFTGGTGNPAWLTNNYRDWEKTK